MDLRFGFLFLCTQFCDVHKKNPEVPFYLQRTNIVCFETKYLVLEHTENQIEEGIVLNKTSVLS